MKLLRNTFIYILLGFLPMAANFLLAPLYTSFLTPEQYSIVGIATLFQTFITIFISLSLDGAYNRLFFDYTHSKLLESSLLSTLVLSVLLTSALIFLIFFFAGDTILAHLLKNQVFRFSNYGFWVLLTTTASVIIIFFSAYYRNKENIAAFSLLNTGLFVMQVTGTLIGLVGIKKGVDGVIAGRAIGSLLALIIALLYFIRKIHLRFNTIFLIKAFRYALPLIPYQLMFIAFSNIDRIMLERRFTAHDFGVYNFAALISGVTLIFVTAMYNAINPRIYKSLISPQQNHSYIKKINEITVLANLGFICLCVAVVVPALRMFINIQYADSYNYIGVLFLSYIPYLHYLVFSIPLFFHGKTRAFPIISFFALITGIAFNLIFIPSLGVWAVCLSLYLIRAIQLTGAYVFTRIFGYTYKYLHQSKLFFTSFLMLTFYNVSLFFCIRYHIFNIDIVNVFPLSCFIVSILFFYRNELKDASLYAILKIYKKAA